MFTLTLIDDDIPIHPADFGDDFRLRLKIEIQNKYVDRVVPNVGLCVAFYDFVEIREANVYPGDGKKSCGEAYCKVEFRLITFAPALDEWLVGTIANSTQAGLSVSLGFFADIEIPSVNLRTPYTYDNRQNSWVWRWENPETRDVVNFFYRKDELIRVRVTQVLFPPATGPKDRRRESTMKVVGAVDRDGLGCVSWWPASHHDEDDGANSASACPAPISNEAVLGPAPLADAPLTDAPPANEAAASG